MQNCFDFIMSKKKRKNINLIITLCVLFIWSGNVNTKDDSQFCPADDKNECATNQISSSFRYILYDVNPPEGFNLRRDVYMRLAVFAHKLKQSKNKDLQKFKLVLPPWSGLYHWRSHEINLHIPWLHFFDLNSLQKFAPVIEMYQFFDEQGSNYKKINIDEVYIMQNFEDMFETGNFEERMAIEKCPKNKNVNFYEYDNITSDNIKCLSFHGHASQLTTILEKSNSRSILFHHAEIALHDSYGDRIYWKARRSMRFNKNLRLLANEFREKYLNSTDESDNTVLPDDWTQEKPHRNAKGGPYLCVHLRRRDFLWGRPQEIPDIDNAVEQIEQILEKNNLKTVFIATDAPADEYNMLKENLSKKYIVHKYNPSNEVMRKHKDGGVAIIEQIICSHAKYFVGTHESTFSFRIQEEREILGFLSETTFNRLCGNDAQNCERPSIWKIVY